MATIRYSVTRHRVELRAYRAVGISEPLTAGPGLAQAAWVTPDSIADYPLGSAQRRLARQLETGGDGRDRPGP